MFFHKISIIVLSILFAYGKLEDTRVVGGNKAGGPIPYQVSFQLKSKSFDLGTFSFQEWSHFCGGSIVSENYVLTAAHCVDGMDKNKFTIVSEISKRSQSGKRHSVEKYIKHPDYKELVTCDIALVKVKEPFEFNNSTVSKIDYTDKTRIQGNVPVILTGWGYSIPLPIGPLPDDLQMLKYITMTNEQCKKEGFNVTESEICCYKGLFRGACSGDSGGPLVNAERTKQIGIVSYGTAICSIGMPDAYTRVSGFVDWINENISNA